MRQSSVWYPVSATSTESQKRKTEMPRHATARIEDAELKLSEPAPPEEMVQRKLVAARLRAKMAKPATEHDKKLWQEFMDLGRERLTFRS
jgi:hypothetical protein